MKKLIYCIPGLGANEAMFSRLKLEHADVKPLALPTPLVGETLQSYASRLIVQIDLDHPFYLLGQSFGGILSLEIARLCQPETVILVSGVKCPKELPWYGRLIGRLRLHHLTPLNYPRYTAPISMFLNGIETEEDRAVFRSFAATRDLGLLKWSIDQTMKWPGCPILDNLVHVHGTADRLLPGRYVRPDVWIEGGTHFMMVTRGAEISTLIDQLVSR